MKIRIRNKNTAINNYCRFGKIIPSEATEIEIGDFFQERTKRNGQKEILESLLEDRNLEVEIVDEQKNIPGIVDEQEKQDETEDNEEEDNEKDSELATKEKRKKRDR